MKKRSYAIATAALVLMSLTACNNTPEEAADTVDTMPVAADTTATTDTLVTEEAAVEMAPAADNTKAKAKKTKSEAKATIKEVKTEEATVKTATTLNSTKKNAMDVKDQLTDANAPKTKKTTLSDATKKKSAMDALKKQ